MTPEQLEELHDLARYRPALPVHVVRAYLLRLRLPDAGTVGIMGFITCLIEAYVRRGLADQDVRWDAEESGYEVTEVLHPGAAYVMRKKGDKP